MKKIALLIGFVTVGFAASTQVSAQAVLGPKITFDQDFVDYGDVEFSGNGERVWKFKNTGKEPLMITNAKGSCGCTVPTYPKEAIMPGKTGEITIKYDTKRPGPIAKTVTITTNEPEGSNTHVIKVKGNVKDAPSNNGVPVKEQGGAPVGM
ncbi:MAG: DUF1573 domain-containing protein [Flavobacteriales bacterium]|nr:DUF1573 domain-containing protein [Flavobacteriales bacterium]